MTSHTALLIRASAVAALLVAGPLALAGCSSAQPDAAPTSTASGTGAKWGACMRDAGFDVPDPTDAQVSSGTTTVPQGVDETRYATQASTCSEQLGVARSDSAQRQEWARQYDRVASCIRERGFDDFPEQREGAIDTNGYPRAQDPAFQQTFTTCLQEHAPDTQMTGQ